MGSTSDIKVGLIFQRDHDDAFVALTGAAALIEEDNEVHRLWRAAYDPFFPSDADRVNAAFVEVNVERMELWIRGVTGEPFGLHATTLERRAGGAWCFSDLNAA